MKTFLILISFVATFVASLPAATTTQLVINVGTTANDHTGESWRSAMQKCNTNFSTLFSGVTAAALAPNTYVQTNGVTVTGTNAAVSILGTGTGNTTLFAFTTNSARIHLLAAGLISTGSNPTIASNLTLSLKIGSAANYTAGPLLLSNSLDGVTWRLDTWVIVPVGGASANIGNVTWLQIGSGSPYLSIGGNAFNSLTNNPLDVTAQFAAGNATNSLTCNFMILESGR